jgi:transposase
MGRKSKHIILTDEERRRLEEGYKQGTNHIFRRHCEAVLLNASGKTIKELSVHFSVRVHTVGLWIQNWLSLGIDGLKLVHGRGRKRKVAETDTVILNRIENLLEQESRHLNHILVALEEEFAIRMCKKTLKRLLRKKNIVGNVAVQSAPKSHQKH